MKYTFSAIVDVDVGDKKVIVIQGTADHNEELQQAHSFVWTCETRSPVVCFAYTREKVINDINRALLPASACVQF